MPHDSKSGEKMAGWAHLAFSALYLFAMMWHGKAALEHWGRIDGRDTSSNGTEGIGRVSSGR